MLGIPPCETAFHARMSVVRLAVFVGHHAHHVVALHLRLEGAADAAIGAGGYHRLFGLADFDHGLLQQRAGRARLHAGAAGHTFGVQNFSSTPGGNHGGEAATVDGQRESALHLFAGAHAARADDALGGIEGEIGIGVVHAGIAVDWRRHNRSALRAGRRRLPSPAVRSRRWPAGQAVQRMIGDIELHHAFAQPLEPVALRPHHHAVRRPASCRTPACPAALDLDQAQPAGTERVQRVGGAQLRDLDAGLHRRAHDRRARRHRDLRAVDGQRDLFSVVGGGVP